MFTEIWPKLGDYFFICDNRRVDLVELREMVTHEGKRRQRDTPSGR
jgi:hypothetical protein